MITAADDAGKPGGRDQAGLGMFSLIVSLAILGLLAAIAVIAIPSDTTKVPGTATTSVGGAAPADPGGAVHLGHLLVRMEIERRHLVRGRDRTGLVRRAGARKRSGCRGRRQRNDRLAARRVPGALNHRS